LRLCTYNLIIVKSYWLYHDYHVCSNNQTWFLIMFCWL